MYRLFRPILIAACSGREGDGDFIKEIDDILRARACALSRGRLGITERLRRAGEDFRISLPRFKRNRIALNPLVYLI